jgi:succinyldiaminopimelate transaminase
VDPTPELARRALAAASDAPGYPPTAGTPELAAAVLGWLRRRGVQADAVGVLPTVGSKELVAALALQLGAHRRVAVPELAYPTYAVGAALAGCDVVATDDVTALDPDDVDLVWLNTPANPTGAVLPVEALRAVVRWARAGRAVVACDECYADFGFAGEPPSILAAAVCDGTPDRLLAVCSLSKRSNLAGYRAGFVAGDPSLVAGLLQVRRHAGLIVPAPVQAAMAAVLADDAHVAEQRERYRDRRSRLLPALGAAGFTVTASEAGLYLWAGRGEDCWASVEWLAGLGIVVAPGSFYGAAGARHVRVAVTASDERIAAAAERLHAAPGA